MIYTFNAKDYLLYPVMKSCLGLSDADIYDTISESFNQLIERLKMKNVSYEKMQGALVPNQDKKKSEVCFVVDTSKVDSNFYGYYIFEKVIPLLDRESTYSIMCGDYIDLSSGGYDSQESLKEMLNEGLVKYNSFDYKHSNQYFLIYFSRLTKNQREQIIEGLSMHTWFVGYVDVTHSSRFKSYISYVLAHAYVKCHNQIIGEHPIDYTDEENINMLGYPFEENGYSYISINEESFSAFLSYKIQTEIPNETDVGFSFNALFPRFDSINKLQLKVSDKRWNDYLTKHGKDKKGALLQSIGYGVEDKDRFIKEVYKQICQNYIYNLQKDEYGNLRFNVCIDMPTINGNYRKTTVALIYSPDVGEMNILTVT